MSLPHVLPMFLLTYEPPLHWLGDCCSLARENVTGRYPGVPDITPPRCAIVRGHCPPIYDFTDYGAVLMRKKNPPLWKPIGED